MDRLSSSFRRITTDSLQKMKRAGEPIAMLTSYDYSMARLVDGAGIDVLLVGDSASNVMAGHETTLPITLEQMIYHASSVIRAVKRALVVVDLPFGSYSSAKQAVSSATRIMKESGAHGVKLEGGGKDIAESVRRLTEMGIPVMGHVGLTPQSIYRFGTYRVRGRDNTEGEKIIEDAVRLGNSGCFGVVLEKVPALLAERITQSLDIPTIGIGAGEKVDGQVLVLHDMLGLTEDFNPRFIKRYAQLGKDIDAAVKQYCIEVKERRFPDEPHAYK